MVLFSIGVGSFCTATGLITSPAAGLIIQKLFHSWNINCCIWPCQNTDNVCSLALPAEVMKVLTLSICGILVVALGLTSSMITFVALGNGW